MNSIAPYFQRIRPIVLGLMMVMLTFTATGCRICADCEDLDYPAYGGAWQRTLRQSGRVGSVFDPGGAKAAALVERTTPEDADQIERRRLGSEDNPGDPDQDDPDQDSDLGDDSDAESPESMKDRERKLREKELDDIESDPESKIRGKELDDIEVRIVPGRAPVMVNSN